MSHSFQWSHLIAGIGILIFSLFLLYVFRLILIEKGWTVNKLEHYFRKRYPTQQSTPSGPSESKGEAHSRKVATDIFGKSFEKIRPDMLKNNVTGQNLELDLYNDELKLGIEYSGAQHYKFIPFFHKNYETFMNQKYRDEIKRMLCEKNGIKLIEIPYTVKLEDIENYIRLEAKRLGYDI